MGIFYGKAQNMVYFGRYEGEYLASDRSGKHWAIKDLSICQRNVAELNIIDSIPRYFLTMTWYVMQIKWRDHTEGRIIVPERIMKMVIESIKNVVEPY